MKPYFLPILLLSAVAGYGASLNITNYPKAATVRTGDYVLGITNNTKTALLSVNDIAQLAVSGSYTGSFPALTVSGSGASISANGWAVPLTTTWTAISFGTNFVVNPYEPATSITAATNIYLSYTTNIEAGVYQEKVFYIKGSVDNFRLDFGTDFTNRLGSWTTNGYIFGNSNGVHVLSVSTRGSRGTEVIAVSPPTN